MRRRAFLAGSAVVLGTVALGGGWWAWDRGVFSTGEGPAYEPWKTWNRPREPRTLELVQSAILAANPHNSQPWRFRLTETAVEIQADTSRNMGAMDPYLREVQIGLGCALENLLLAARARGFRPQVSAPVMNGESLAIRVDLTPAEPEMTDLYQAIPHRRTNRGYYDTARPVAPEQLQRLSALAGEDVRLFWFAEDAQRKQVGDLLIEATDAIIADPEQMAGSSHWERFDWRSVQTHRDGITLDAQGLSPLMRALAKVVPSSPEQGVRFWREATAKRYVGTAAAFGILAVPSSREPRCRVAGGQAYQRIHLKATALGLAMQPLNQLTERADRERQLGLAPRFGSALAELTGPGWDGLLSFRIGYPADEALLSPRRPVEQVLL